MDETPSDEQLQQPQEQEVDQSQVESENEILNRIYVGDFNNLPSLASKVVRIFTSSTFTGICWGESTTLILYELTQSIFLLFF